MCPSAVGGRGRVEAMLRCSGSGRCHPECEIVDRKCVLHMARRLFEIPLIITAERAMEFTESLGMPFRCRYSYDKTESGSGNTYFSEM